MKRTLVAAAIAMLVAGGFGCSKKDKKDKTTTQTKTVDAAAVGEPQVARPRVGSNELRARIKAAGACTKDADCIGPRHPCRPGCGVTYNPKNDPGLERFLSAANKGITCRQACNYKSKARCVKTKCTIVK